MKNRTKILLLIIIIGIIIIASLLIAYRDSSIKEKADKIFGNDYCTTNHSMEVGGAALTNWKCKICGKVQTYGQTNTPKLCDDCANETGRCNKCGKLKR